MIPEDVVYKLVNMRDYYGRNLTYFAAESGNY